MKSDGLGLHPDDQDLGLYLLERLPEDSLSAVEAHLTNCAVCDQRLVQEISSLSASSVAQLGNALTGEMRKEPRYRTDETVSLQALNPFSPDRYSGRLADVSRSGMKLQIPVRVERGTLIKIGLKNMIAFGEVRYCVPVGDVFHFGVHVSQTVQLRSHE
jgi:PilZ domain